MEHVLSKNTRKVVNHVLYNRYFDFADESRPRDAKEGETINLTLIERGNSARKVQTIEINVAYREDFPCGAQLKGRLMQKGIHYNVEINLNQNRTKDDFVVLIPT